MKLKIGAMALPEEHKILKYYKLKKYIYWIKIESVILNSNKL